MGTPLRKYVRPAHAPVPEGVGRRIVRERSGGLCELALPGICLGRAAGVHHRVKRGQGGSWSPANLLDACGSGTNGCHGWAEANPTEAHSLGISLWRSEDPEVEWATIRWAGQRSRWRLTADGSLEHDLEADFEDVSWGPGADTTPPTPWGA